LLGLAERSARRLERIPHPTARCTARLGRAALACASGDIARACEQLEAAREVARSHHMEMYAAAATRRLGLLHAGAVGDALVAEADASMRAQAIVRTDRMAALLAPGCDPY
jgi:hypothetical protein